MFFQILPALGFIFSWVYSIHTIVKPQLFPNIQYSQAHVLIIQQSEINLQASSHNTEYSKSKKSLCLILKLTTTREKSLFKNIINYYFY